MHNERRAIIDADAFFEWLVDAGDLEESSRGFLRRRHTSLRTRECGQCRCRQKHRKLESLSRFLVFHKSDRQKLLLRNRFKNLVERDAFRKLRY